MEAIIDYKAMSVGNLTFEECIQVWQQNSYELGYSKNILKVFFPEQNKKKKSVLVERECFLIDRLIRGIDKSIKVIKAIDPVDEKQVQEARKFLEKLWQKLNSDCKSSKTNVFKLTSDFFTWTISKMPKENRGVINPQVIVDISKLWVALYNLITHFDISDN